MTPPFRTFRNFRYDERREQYRADYDDAPAGELLVDVVLGVAEVLGVGTDDLEPAHECIDTDAFDALVRSSGRRSFETGPITFDIEGCRVTVDEGEVTFDRSAA